MALFPDTAAAQRRVAVPRAPVTVRPGVVVRTGPTIFVGGYFFPRLYRPALYYGRYRPYFDRGYYGGPFYDQWPPYAFAYALSGSMRLQVAPQETEVFIDGYFAGTVDEFDGLFQRLNIEPGEHEIELYLAGHRPYRQRVYLQPGRTFRIRHTMEPLAAGESEPARPAGAPLPPPGARGGSGRTLPDPRSAPEVRAQDFGQLSLRVQPDDAEVLIDGDPWTGSVTDERLVVQLGAGLHRLEIRKEGYRSYFTDVTIRSGETRTLNVALTPSQ